MNEKQVFCRFEDTKHTVYSELSPTMDVKWFCLRELLTPSKCIEEHQLQKNAFQHHFTMGGNEKILFFLHSQNKNCFVRKNMYTNMLWRCVDKVAVESNQPINGNDDEVARNISVKKVFHMCHFEHLLYKYFRFDLRQN